jgi:hypothetical protein
MRKAIKIWYLKKAIKLTLWALRKHVEGSLEAKEALKYLKYFEDELALLNKSY